MILIDGMPIVSSLSSVYGLSGIPNSLVEQIEIVKGPASSLYGSEAVGGLINIITKKPKNAAQAGRVAVAAAITAADKARKDAEQALQDAEELRCAADAERRKEARRVSLLTDTLANAEQSREILAGSCKSLRDRLAISEANREDAEDDLDELEVKYRCVLSKKHQVKRPVKQLTKQDVKQQVKWSVKQHIKQTYTNTHTYTYYI